MFWMQQSPLGFQIYSKTTNTRLQHKLEGRHHRISIVCGLAVLEVNGRNAKEVGFFADIWSGSRTTVAIFQVDHQTTHHPIQVGPCTTPVGKS